MSQAVNRRSRLIEYSLYLGCLLSNLSQLPFFVSGGLTQQVSFPGWILLFASVLLIKGFKITRSMLRQVTFAFLIILWLLIDTLITSASFFSSSMIYSYVISIFIFFLGTSVADEVDQRVLKNIIIIFTASMVVVSAAIFVQYFGFGYSLATRIYAYSSKNSVSQLIFTAIILVIMRLHPKNMLWKVVRVGVLLFELYLLLLLRSRATLVSLILCIFTIVFSRNTKKGIKIAVGIAGTVVIVLLFTNDQFNNFIFNNVLFANRNVTNLNDLTSGRVDIIGSFPGLISGKWLTGIGSTYFECFPLSAILQFGIIGGILLIIVSLCPLASSLLRQSLSNEWFLLLLLSIGYSVNGLFEGLTPFGPGVKCYFMWLLYGILLTQSMRQGADINGTEKLY